jgi:MscS family membrane protein
MQKLIFLLFFVSTPLFASELNYVKTDSPRDTMETFINAMNDYKAGVLNNDLDKKDRIYDAVRCFAEKDTAVLVSQERKELAAIFLKEVIDRVIVIDFGLIPETLEKNRWRLKSTEIVLRPSGGR